MTAEELIFIATVIRTAKTRAEIAEWWEVEKPHLINRFGLEGAKRIHAEVLAHARSLEVGT